MLEAKIALKNRINVILYMNRVNREVTCAELLDELVVDMSVSKLNHLLKRLVADGFATMRGVTRQTHYYTLKNEIVEQIAQSVESRSKTHSGAAGSKAA